MNQTVTDFLNKFDGLTLEMRLERLKNQEPLQGRRRRGYSGSYEGISLFREIFKTYLWKDIVKETGRLFDKPGDEVGFEDYSISLLYSTDVPKICVDSENKVEEGDIVIITEDFERIRRQFPSFNRHFSNRCVFHLNDVGIYLKKDIMGDTKVINAEGIIGDVNDKSFFKIVPNPTIGKKIGVGDKVRVNSTQINPSDIAQFVEEDEGAENDRFDDGAYVTNRERKLKGYSRKKQIPVIKTQRARAIISTMSESTEIKGLERGNTYFVAGVSGPDLYLATTKGQVVIPEVNVVKVSEPSKMSVDDNQLNEVIRNMVFEFYERKGIIRKCGVIRQILLNHVQSSNEKEIRKAVIDMGVNYDNFLKCCEVLSYATRTR